MPKASVILKDIEKAILNDSVTMQYTLETQEPALPHQEAENPPELTKVDLYCGVRPKGLKSYPKHLGFESDVEFELLFSVRYLKSRGFDVLDPPVLSKLAKANFIVDGLLCTSVKTPILSGKLTGLSDKNFVTFYVKRMRRSRA